MQNRLLLPRACMEAMYIGEPDINIGYISLAKSAFILHSTELGQLSCMQIQHSMRVYLL